MLEKSFRADLILIESNLSVTGTVSRVLIGEFKSIISFGLLKDASVGAGSLKGIRLFNLFDLFVLFVLKDCTSFKNLSELNEKESPRLKWGAKILKKMGVKTITSKNSIKIYGNPNYHWTFYLMNDNLREQGWPSSHDKILHKAKRDYPNTTITTRTDLTTITGFFKTGDTIEGRTSGATAKIIHRNLDLGQIIVNNIVGGPFVASELLQMT